MADETKHPEHPQHEAADTATGSPVETGAKEYKIGLDGESKSLATAAVVGVGVAILEPELIPGILIGAGAVLAPKILPAIGGILRPMVKGLVKAGYSTAMSVREMIAEAGEEMEDMVAEARAEHEADAANGAASEHVAPPKKQRRPVRPPNPATAL